MIKIFGILLLTVFGFSAFAYIPPARFILNRAVQNNGDGNYQIEQEVVFNNEDQNIVFNETWIVANENTLRVNVSGTKEWQNIKFSFLYKNGAKLTTSNESNKGTSLSPTFLEKYFHFRKLESLMWALIQAKILPQNAINKKALPAIVTDIEYSPEKFVRLARLGGGISYAFGSPTPLQSEKALPALWVEQDQFLIRKLRFEDQSELRAEKYNTYSRGLMLPLQRVVQWGKKEVKINLIKVQGVSSLPSGGQMMKQSSLPAPAGQDLLVKLPIRETVEEFYQRFR